VPNATRHRSQPVQSASEIRRTCDINSHNSATIAVA
jgi:hypothetical protein